MSKSYVRCSYTSPDGFECETWTESLDGKGEMCPVHVGSVSTHLAANGVNKESYLARRNEIQFSLLEATKDLDAQAKLAYYNKHIAGIEKIIEEQKLIVLTTRALRQTELEGLTEDERKERRKIQTVKSDREKKVKSAVSTLSSELKAKEKAIAGIISQRAAQGKQTSREQAIAIFEMD